MAEAAEPIGVVAKEVRADGADADPLILRVRSQARPVVDSVPGHVDRDAGTAAGEGMDERRIVDPLVDGAGGSGPRVDVEASARVAVAPRGRLDLEPTELFESLGLGHERSLPHSRRSEEHTSELLSRPHLVCRLLLEKKKKKK